MKFVRWARLCDVADGDAAIRDIDSIEADVSLPNLQVLLLGENKLTSIDALGLSKLTNLRSLFLQNNMITCVEGLSCLTALEELVSLLYTLGCKAKNGTDEISFHAQQVF